MRRRRFVAAAVLVTGVLLVEGAARQALSGHVLSGQVLRAYGGGRAYVLVTSVEEGLEMAGAALLLAALLCELGLRRSRAASAAARA